MARYRPVYTQIWNKQDIQQLSERQRLLFIYLFTNQHTTESGIYAITPITMAHETGIPLRFIEKVLKEFPVHMIKYDWKNHCVFVVNFMNYNRWGNPNIIKKSVIRDIRLTKTFLWKEFITKYPLYYEELLSIDKGIVTFIKGTNSNDNDNEDDNDIVIKEGKGKPKKPKKPTTPKKPPDPDLQEIIDYATQQGFSLQGSQEKNRQYAYNLMRKKDPDGNKFGKDRVKQLIDMARECRGEQYAPTVNDFKQLYYKFMDVISFIDKKNKGGRIG